MIAISILTALAVVFIVALIIVNEGVNYERAADSSKKRFADAIARCSTGRRRDSPSTVAFPRLDADPVAELRNGGAI
jgi:hypothetical protein